MALASAYWQIKRSVTPKSRSVADPHLVHRAILAAIMKFEVGNHVAWNSEAGHVHGRIVKVHTRDFDYKGHTHRATKDDPQYEIKSDVSDHIAAHKGSALHKIK